jgi:formylglycine-generating enzyme required for sulfatase activity
VTKLKEKYLGLIGYRLPTEAEMEYATRAGAITSRYYGEADELLAKYAWYNKNSDEKTWPVASKKPNDFGFFDLHGNVWNWCQEQYQTYPATDENEVTTDEEHVLNIIATNSRLLRGGSFLNQASSVRSAYRNIGLPADRSYVVGFRPARTLRLDRLTPLPLPPKAGDFEN